MKKRLIGMVGVALIFSFGCANQYQYQVDQTLLLQENQRLEDALYVTHTQLVDLKRENEMLKAAQNGTKKPAPSSSSSGFQLFPGRSNKAEPQEDYDDAPPFAPPEIIIPETESTAPPDRLRTQKGITFPETVESATSPWNPTRN